MAVKATQHECIYLSENENKRNRSTPNVMVVRAWSLLHGLKREKKNARIRSQHKGKQKKHQHALKNSYESQHNALLGMCVTTRGVSPLENPRIPSRRQMILSASNMPRQ